MAEVLYMDAKFVNYTEEKIQFFFQRGAPRTKAGAGAGAGEGDVSVSPRPRSDESVLTMYRGLNCGEIRVQNIPRIRGIKYNGSWYTFDNKRLWVLRQYGGEVPVQVVDRPTNWQLAKLSRVERDGIGKKDPELVDKESDKRFQAHEFNCKQELLGRVLKWSIRDLLAARPHEEIAPIPLRHSTAESYMELLSQWLLEETRAQLQQSILKIVDLASVGVKIDAEVRSMSKLKHGLRRMNCSIQRDAIRWSKQAKTYRPAASDIVLLATFSPQKPAELLTHTDECITLGVVQGGHMSGSSFEVMVSADTHTHLYKELKREDTAWYAVKLESIVTCQRIWDSLHHAANTPLAEYIATYQKPPQSIDTPRTTLLDEAEVSKLRTYCNEVRRLNLSQTETVQGFITRLLDREQEFSVELIQGPPGTGKTSTLTAMLSPTVCTSTRILVCAPTNTAVNEAARRFLAQKQQDPQLHFCSDFVASASADSQSRCCTALRLGDIVMLGSEDRLAVEGSTLEAIFLPIRVKRLMTALHPDSGYVALVQTFVMKLTEIMEPTQNDSVEERLVAHIVLRNFGLRLIAHGEVLCNDLPTPHLSTRRMNSIMATSCCIRNLLGLLAREGRNEGEVGEHSSEQDEERVNMEKVVVINDDDDDAPRFSPTPHKEQEENASCYSDEFTRECHNLLELFTATEVVPIFPQPGATSFEWVETECLESASLVFSTVSSAGLRIMRLGLPFSCVIIDEAAQLVEAESTIIMQMKDVKQLILVGDQKQLPATVISQLAQKYGYGRSLFERLHSMGHPCRLLEVQYRMHPAISAFPNKQFYNRKLKNGDNVLEENYGQLSYHKDTFGPYAFIDIGDSTEVNAGSSKKNVLEAELVLHLIKRVYDSVRADHSSPKPITVGVISPYSGQVLYIKDQMCRSDSIYDVDAADPNVLEVEVRSIDGFQGRESDIIIFSAVRANQSGKIGFVDDERRTNVALTRGRHAVWILGSASTLCSHSRLWRSLVDDARQVDCFVKASRVDWMNDLITIHKKRFKPVLQPRGGEGRVSKFSQLPTPVSPKKSGWESEEPPKIDGPDWSSVASLVSPFTWSEADRKEDELMRKRARTERDHRRVDHHYDSRHQESECNRDRRRQERHPEYHRYQQYNDTRSDRGLSSASDEVSYDVQTLNHGWEDPNTWGMDLPNQDSWNCDQTPGIGLWEADWDSS